MLAVGRKPQFLATPQGCLVVLTVTTGRVAAPQCVIRSSKVLSDLPWEEAVVPEVSLSGVWGNCNTGTILEAGCRDTCLIHILPRASLKAGAQ